MITDIESGPKYPLKKLTKIEADDAPNVFLTGISFCLFVEIKSDNPNSPMHEIIIESMVKNLKSLPSVTGRLRKPIMIKYARKPRLRHDGRTERKLKGDLD